MAAVQTLVLFLCDCWKGFFQGLMLCGAVRICEQGTLGWLWSLPYSTGLRAKPRVLLSVLMPEEVYGSSCSL